MQSLGHGCKLLVFRETPAVILIYRYSFRTDSQRLQEFAIPIRMLFWDSLLLSVYTLHACATPVLHVYQAMLRPIRAKVYRPSCAALQRY